MAPITDFAIKDTYKYLEGFGSYHSSEAFPGATPLVNNTPQQPPYNLRTERISGTAFTAPRDSNLQTWLYRASSSLDHSPFKPYDETPPPPQVPHILTPNSYMWSSAPEPNGPTWTSSQHLLARNGDPATKTGLAIYLFCATDSMSLNEVFSSLDGDALIIPQAGALDIQTELGKLLVRQNEICVIPRGVRYRVALPSSSSGEKYCRGYICELFQGQFRLPDLGPVGSTGLANVRDFQIPTACFDGVLDGGVATADDKEYTIISRQAGRLWQCTQDHTPFDVAAWHGTLYPYKYGKFCSRVTNITVDISMFSRFFERPKIWELAWSLHDANQQQTKDLARFVVLGNLLFDEHDPSLYVVLTAPSHREPGTAVVDFVIIPPRWQVAEDTFWPPYYHRNTMSEFYGPIVTVQDPMHPFNHAGKGKVPWLPFVAGLTPPMTTHGATEEDFEKARNAPLKPTKAMTDGLTIFLLETENPLYLGEWAAESALTNFRARTQKKSSKI